MTPKPNTNANCDAFAASIDQFVDGELSGDAADALQTHLDGCTRCAESAERLHAAQRSLSGLPELRCPDRVFQAVDAELRAEPRSEGSKTKRYLALALATAVAVALMLAPQQPKPEPTPTPTPTEDEQVAQARIAFTELRDALADNDSTVGKRTLRRGLVEPFEKTVAVVGKSKLGEWSATAGAMLNAVSTAQSNKSG